jgi:chemotaxis signal transduction protein
MKNHATLSMDTASPAEARGFRARIERRGGHVDLLLVRVGVEYFGIELDAVEEVLDFPELHRIPEMSDTLLGVFTLRGALVPLYRPHQVLGAAPHRMDAVLVFHGDGRRLALAIDDVDDVLTLQLEALRDVPGPDAGDGVLVGVVRRARDLIGVLDVDALLALLRTASPQEAP